jgi:hypothetical protein
MAKAAEAKMTMRRPQFTLKTLQLLMVVVAVGCVVIPPAWSKLFPRPRSVEDYARERQRLYEQLKARGGIGR